MIEYLDNALCITQKGHCLVHMLNLSWQDPGGDRLLIDLARPILTTGKFNGSDTVLSVTVIDNHRARAIGIQECRSGHDILILNVPKVRSGESSRTSWHKLRELAHHVVIGVL